MRPIFEFPLFYASMDLLIPEQLYSGTEMEKPGQLQFFLAAYYKIIMQYSEASSLLTSHWWQKLSTREGYKVNVKNAKSCKMLGMQILTQGLLEAKGFFSSFCALLSPAAHPADTHKHRCSTDERKTNVECFGWTEHHRTGGRGFKTKQKEIVN